MLVRKITDNGSLLSAANCKPCPGTWPSSTANLIARADKVPSVSTICSAIGLLILVNVPPATAEMGPCLPDDYAGLTCGHGAGAARVIDGTISPSKRLAFAWRSSGRLSTEEPDQDAVESVLIRLSDGVVLWRAPGEYWNTGTYRVNRYEETAAWSPGSRFVVETTDFRWRTEHLRLFHVRAGDKVTVLDLMEIIEPAVRKHLRRVVKNEPAYAFQIFGSANGERPHLTIDDRGRIKALVLMTIPKDDPYAVFQRHGPGLRTGWSARRTRGFNAPLSRRPVVSAEAERDGTECSSSKEN